MSASEQDRRTANHDTLAQFAHELQQPLAAIVGALGVMRARPNRTIGQNAREVVERQIGQIRQLVGDLLDAKRMERGAVRLEMNACDFGQCVEEALEAFRPELEAHQHVWTYTPPVSALHVQADRARMQQVITNLLGNAVKFTPPGGAIAVTVTSDRNHAVFTIRDTGCGIDAQLLSDVFDLYRRGDEQPGDGIGLFVVRRLVELHGGTVEAHSLGAGTGAEFVVRLPLAPHAGASIHAA
jgi:signal transduction histidine kinase